MGVGEVRDELAGVVEVQRGGDVVAAFGVDGRELARGLVDGAVAGDNEVLDAGAFEGDGAEGLLVLRNIVIEYVR
jgi:hypothetical protein